MQHVPARANTLGDLLREARQHREWSLRRVAELIGCTPSYLSDVEHNRRVPAEAMLGRLAKLFGLNLDELMARAGRFGAQGQRYLERHPSAGVLLRLLASGEVTEEELQTLIREVELLTSSKARGPKRANS
jgi:transcriptional regulator with XRE-family HTH domain